MSALILAGASIPVYQNAYGSSLHYGETPFREGNELFDIAALLTGNAGTGACMASLPCGDGLLKSLNGYYWTKYAAVTEGGFAAESGNKSGCGASAYECLPGKIQYCIYVCD